MQKAEYKDYLTGASSVESSILYPKNSILTFGLGLIGLANHPLISPDVIGIHGTSFNGVIEMMKSGGLSPHPKRMCDMGTVDFVPLTGKYPVIGDFGIPLIDAITYAAIYGESSALFDVLEEALPFVPGYVEWRNAAHNRSPEIVGEVSGLLAQIWDYDKERMRRLVGTAIQRKGFLVGLSTGILKYSLKPGEGVIDEPNELEIDFSPRKVLPITNPDGSQNIVSVVPCGPLEAMFLESLRSDRV